MTLTASGMTSFPIPSPGIIAIRFFRLTAGKATYQARVMPESVLSRSGQRAAAPKRCLTGISDLSVSLTDKRIFGKGQPDLFLIAAGRFARGSCLLGTM